MAQFVAHLGAQVRDEEAELARDLLPAAAWGLWVGMPVADRRHGLDVALRLRARGFEDRDLLAAALLHDAAKGHRMRVWHRVAGVVLEALTPGFLVWLASADPASWRHPFHLHLHHAELSAQAAAEAGCSQRTAAFIRGASARDDAPMAIALHAADEAS